MTDWKPEDERPAVDKFFEAMLEQVKHMPTLAPLPAMPRPFRPLTDQQAIADLAIALLEYRSRIPPRGGLDIAYRSDFAAQLAREAAGLWLECGLQAEQVARQLEPANPSPPPEGTTEDA